MAEEEKPKRKRPMPSGWRPKHGYGKYKYKRKKPPKKRGSKPNLAKIFKPAEEAYSNLYHDKAKGLAEYVAKVIEMLELEFKRLEDKRLSEMQMAIEFAEKGDYILCRTYLRSAEMTFNAESEIDRQIQALTYPTKNDSDLYAVIKQVYRMRYSEANKYITDIKSEVLPLIIEKQDEMLPEHAGEYANMIQKDLDMYAEKSDIASFLIDVLERRIELDAIPEQILTAGTERHGESNEEADT